MQKYSNWWYAGAIDSDGCFIGGVREFCGDQLCTVVHGYALTATGAPDNLLINKALS